MQSFEIIVPDDKIHLVKDILRELGVTVKTKSMSKIPNPETIEAMDELKAGKGKKFKNADNLFNSI
jgi:hypothetical protein